MIEWQLNVEVLGTLQGFGGWAITLYLRFNVPPWIRSVVPSEGGGPVGGPVAVVRSV